MEIQVQSDVQVGEADVVTRPLARVPLPKPFKVDMGHGVYTINYCAIPEMAKCRLGVGFSQDLEGDEVTASFVPFPVDLLTPEQWAIWSERIRDEAIALLPQHVIVPEDVDATAES
jgi:hypothetical protein